MREYKTSVQLFERSKARLPGGVASSLRSSMKPVPLFATGGKGATVADVDGNEYIDFLLAYGPLILGHSHPYLNQKLSEAMRQGYSFGLQHEGEIALAERLTRILPCADQVAFSGSGTEAVMLALRLARAYTGRSKVVRFHGHYHGWSDPIFTSFPNPDFKPNPGGNGETVVPGTNGQSAKSLEEIILLPWNDREALEHTLRGMHRDIAAVITEPVMCNSGCIEPAEGYLSFLKALTQELGIVLIFDEVITGFRLSLAGAHGKFGILPDLMTMGKALGGGIALSAVAGRAEIMNLIADGKVNHLGTLNGNNLAMAAGLATLDVLESNQQALFTQMTDIANVAAEGLRSLLRKHRLRGVVNQGGPVYHMMFVDCDEVVSYEQYLTRDAAKYVRFAELMLNEGILLRPNGLWYVSTEHAENHIEVMLSAADRVLGQL